MLRDVRVGGVGGVMLTFICTYIMKLMLRDVRVGGGRWGDVNVHLHLHHEVDATWREGWGWVGWGDVNVHLHLHHEVDAMV